MQGQKALARVCTIAGSDSGGGAGIQADLKTIHSLGSYGLSVVTALTAQNTAGVQAVHIPPSQFVRQQFESVQGDIRIDAFKIGMLANEDIVRELGSLLKTPSSNRTPIVLDPVMVSTSGSMLLPHEAVQALIAEVFPRCTVVTPNVAEAIEILKRSPKQNGSKTHSVIEELTGNRDSTSVSEEKVRQVLTNVLWRSDDSQGEDQEATSKELGRIAARISAQDSDRSSTILKALAVLEDAESIALLGSDACLLKGGHAPIDRSDFDLLFGLETEEQDDAKKWSSASPYVEWESAVRQEPSTSAGLVYRIGSVDVVRMDHRPWSIALDRWAEKEASDDQPDSGSVVVDVLYQSQPGPGQSKRTMFVSKHSPSTSTHGTGCTLSSALATFLAQGHTLRAASGLAINYVAQGIPRGVEDLGSGAGPLDHGLTSDLLAHQRRAIPPSAPHDRTPLNRALVGHDVQLWLQYTRHDFVKRILVATDDTDAAFWDGFAYFLRQDYLFLQHYGRMFAIAAAATSASSHPDAQAEMESFSRTAAVCMLECQKHLDLCEENGISRQMVTERTKESAAVVAYTRFVLDVGHGGGGSAGGVLAMLVAMGPCALGYAEVGLWLASRRRELRKASGEPESYAVLHQTDRASLPEALRHRIAYDAWIDTYSSDEFQDSVGKSIGLMERKAQQSPLTVAKLSEYKRIWTAAVRLEIGMWDEAVDPSVRRPIVDPY
ncbi:hypothetical protein CF319_g2500 [Tilletia indica]|nr:hypothetical protein CF319_g2500 [Tilletia indica]